MNVAFIIDQGLCSGCGGCSASCPQEAISMERGNDLNFPIINNKCVGCGKCVLICPSFDNYKSNFIKKYFEHKDFKRENKTYICFANEKEIRKDASSGGYITALSIFLLMHNNFKGIISLKKCINNPFEYDGAILDNTQSIEQAEGSKYFPVSVCEALRRIDEIDGPLAFIGKPCEVHATRLIMNESPKIKSKVKLLISIFCHHTPPRKKVKKTIECLGITLGLIKEIKYRGDGWPGKFKIIDKNNKIIFELPYRKIWDEYFAKEMPLACKLCHDPFGEFSDISVGDAWGFGDETNMGLSAVILRTDIGQKLHKEVLYAKEISCCKILEKDLYIGQQSLLLKQRSNPNIDEGMRMIRCYFEIKRFQWKRHRI